MFGQIEMDLYDACARHNHETHHYCTRQGACHTPYGALRAIPSSSSSDDQTTHAKFVEVITMSNQYDGIQ